MERNGISVRIIVVSNAVVRTADILTPTSGRSSITHSAGCKDAAFAILILPDGRSGICVHQAQAHLKPCIPQSGGVHMKPNAACGCLIRIAHALEPDSVVENGCAVRHCVYGQGIVFNRSGGAPLFAVLRHRSEQRSGCARRCGFGVGVNEVDIAELQTGVIGLGCKFPDLLVFKTGSKLHKIHAHCRIIRGGIIARTSSVKPETGQREIVPTGGFGIVPKVIASETHAHILPCAVRLQAICVTGSAVCHILLAAVRVRTPLGRRSRELRATAFRLTLSACSFHQKREQKINALRFACVNIKHDAACAAPVCRVDTLLGPRQLILFQRFIVPVLGYLRILCVIHARVAPVHPQFRAVDGAAVGQRGGKGGWCLFCIGDKRNCGNQGKAQEHCKT